MVCRACRRSGGIRLFLAQGPDDRLDNHRPRRHVRGNRACLRGSAEAFPQPQRIPEAEARREEPAELPDRPAVDKRAYDRSQLHALEAAEADEDERHGDGNQAAAAVIYGLRPADVPAVCIGELLDEELICLWRYIRIEEERDT